LLTKVSCGVLLSSALFAQNLQTPQALTVVSATNKQVQLRWTAGDSVATGYTVERKPLGGDYSAAFTATTSTASDTNFDPYTTYVYRVRGTQQTNQSGPSNEVTVAPPPYGYNTAFQYPSSLDPYNAGQLGKAISMILDSSGDPAIAYTWDDPNNDGDYSDTAVYFVRWDRAHYQWTMPVQIHLVGEVGRFALTPISLAQDASNGAFAIAFQDESTPDVGSIKLALSTDAGATWKILKAASDDGQEAYNRPSLAMAGGNLYLTFYHDQDGIRYVTGKQSDDPSKWTSTLVPLPGGYDYYERVSSLALDDKGVPAVAFVASSDTSLAEAFWRPGGSSVLITDNHGYQTDDPDLRLTFFGNQPRVVFYGAVDDNFFADYDHTVWVVTSPDNGTTWSQPVNIASDLGTDLNSPFSIAMGPQGQAALAMESNGGNGTHNCSQPKLAMSGDLVNWTTCGPETAGKVSIIAGQPQVFFSGNGKLILGFQQTYLDEDNPTPLGITVWRQPLPWAFPPPPPVEE
jgi:hypothetical protein